MKAISLIASALCLSLCLASMATEDIAKLMASEVAKKFITILQQDNSEVLLRAILHSHNGGQKFGMVKASNVRSIGLHKRIFREDELYLAWMMTLLPEAALREVGPEQLLKAIQFLPGPLDSYSNFPAEFFANVQFAKTVFANFRAFKDSNWFLSTLSFEQYTKVIQYAPDFHAGQLSGNALNNLALTLDETECKQLMGMVTPRFLDSLNRYEKVALRKDLVENLPSGILKAISIPMSPEDVQLYSTEQLEAFNKAHTEYFIHTQVPPETCMPYLCPTYEQLDRFKASQWNVLLARAKLCDLFDEDEEFQGVSSIAFHSECFAKLDPKVQSYIISHHSDLHDDILFYVNASMVLGWETETASGLNILREAANPRLLTHIGSHYRGKQEHPLKDVDPARLAEHLPPEMMDQLTLEHLRMMNISKPKTLDALRTAAQWVCFREDIFDVINGLTRTSRGGIKREIGFAWSELTALDMKLLTEPSYSRLAASMTLDVFSRLHPAAAAAINPRSIPLLPYLKDMSVEQYHSLGPNAFTFIGPRQHSLLNLRNVSDAQLPHLSEHSRSSIFSVLSAQEHLPVKLISAILVLLILYSKF